MISWRCLSIVSALEKFSSEYFILIIILYFQNLCDCINIVLSFSIVKNHYTMGSGLKKIIWYYSIWIITEEFNETKLCTFYIFYFHVNLCNNIALVQRNFVY